jgi:uncharacterized protein YjbI with pentapeptide repeats
MPCCKADKFKWCGGLDTITSYDGKEYCIFHAPKGREGISINIEKFNERVFKRIEEAKKLGQKCNLSGTLFEGPISFSQYNKENPLPFINFQDVTFISDADFRHVSFNQEANFDRVCFKESVSFWQVDFRGRVSFSEATFFKSAFWSGTKFAQEATFQLANFIEGAYFSDTTFNKSVNFRQSKFQGEMVLGGTFKGPVDFRQVVFTGTIEIRGVFDQEVSFWWSTFKADADFREVAFNKTVDFGRCLIEKSLLFVEVDLSHCSFIDSNIRNCEFIRCKWPRIRGRKALCDEKDNSSYGKVEELYRQLKWKYKIGNNEQEVSSWHYAEKEMYRKKKPWRRFNPFSFSNLYWAFSGYGERPIRAGLMLLLFFASLVLITGSLGLISSSGNSVYGVTAFEGLSDLVGPKFEPELKRIGLLILNTIQYTVFFKTPYFKPETLSGG